MPQYHWKGIDAHGKRQRGLSPAISVSDLKNNLLGKQIALLSCKEAGNTPHILSQMRTIPLQRYAAFFRDLSVILEVGIPLLPALEVTKSYTTSKQLQRVVQKLIEELQRGTSLSTAMKHTKKFSKLMVQITQSGEESDNLQHALQKLAQHLEKKVELAKNIKQAMLLPTVTIAFALCIVASIALFVIPQIKIFLPTPHPQTFIFTLSNFFESEYQRTIALGVLVISLPLIKLSRKITLKSAWTSKIPLFLPVARQITIFANLANFSYTLATLLNTGCTLKKSLLVAQEACTNNVILRDISKAAPLLEQGYSLSDAFKGTGSKHFPSLFLESVSLGEQTGKLAIMLQKCGELLEQRFVHYTKIVTTLLQPLLLVGVGILVALLLLSLYTPILQLGTTF